MSRTKGNSLDYFPLDVDFFSEPRIRRLRARFGSDGPMLLVYVFCRCYGDKGYYVEIDDDFYDDASLDIGCSADKIRLMMNYLLDRSLLESKSFNTVKVLTSHGIQAQYQKSKKSTKKGIEVDGSLWILDDSETEAFVKVRHRDGNSEKMEHFSGKNEVKSGIYPQSKVKESKVNIESKVKESKEAAGPAAAPADDGMARVMSLYMDRVQNMPSSTCVGLLRGYTDNLGPDVVIHAIERALDDNKPHWSYIQAILRRYSEQGLTSMQAVQAEEVRFAEERERERKRREAKKGTATTQPVNNNRTAKNIELLRKMAGGGAK